MLLRLSGRVHKAITAVALYNGRKKSINCRPASCDVSFAPLSQAKIEWYLDTNEWQGVAGLPLRDFYIMLKDNGYLSIC